MHGPYKIGKTNKKYFLKVSSLHTIYVEESGDPSGVPVVHPHGGPGTGFKRWYRKFYNPKVYRIILFDQRGCGKSTPLGEISQNTTQELVSDLEKIREHLKIDKWVVSGASWGSTLALYYAQKFPKRVLALILRAVFTFRKQEIEWVQKEGASYFFPEEFEEYKNFIPKSEQKNLVLAYYKRVTGKDKEVAELSAIKSNSWSKTILSLNQTPKKESTKNIESKVSKEEIGATKIFYHYEVNSGFLNEGELLKNAHKLKGIPGVIIQGRYDMITPPVTAWELHRAWEGSRIIFSPAGHKAMNKSGIKDFIYWSDKFGERFKKAIS